MKIIKLTAENIKRLVAVEITPKGDVVKITGKNGAGKTSVLDAVFWALAGERNIQKLPIRKGEDKARVRLDLGELIVERRWTHKGSTLTVSKSDESRFMSPQTVLDKLLGSLTFDPLAFVRMSASEQFDALRRAVPVDVDFDEIDARNKEDYEARREVNREAKQWRAQADGITVEDGAPDTPVDLTSLMDEISEANDQNQRIARAAEDAAGHAANIANAKTEIENLEGRIARLNDNIRVWDADRLEREKAASAKPVDVGAIRERLRGAEATNAAVAARTQRGMYEASAAAAEAKSKQLTETMEMRAADKERALSAADMPVDGLGFGDQEVLYNDIPLEQASLAEQLRVSCAIAMAGNPQLRVVRITDGSLLDSESMAVLESMAKDRDFQVWLEMVDETGEVGVVIEDGQVAADNQ